MYAAKRCGIVKSLRNTIYDRNKADVKIPGLLKYMRQSYASIRKLAPKLCVCLLFGLGRISNF